MDDTLLAGKIQEFAKAMTTYNKYGIYNKLGFFVSSIIILLQIVSLICLLCQIHSFHFLKLILTFAAAYITADFVNGLVHMYMDNNTNYTSVVGPFIASFHLHHKEPLYKKRSAWEIYFIESGTKFWLVIFLFILVYYQIMSSIPFYLNFFFVSFGIVSSLAEVSHYWCHNSRKSQLVITLLQKCWILLPKKHHAHHHRSDNMNYAFLNGVTDPIINAIARLLYPGYKNHSDKHVLAYNGQQTTNRN